MLHTVSAIVLRTIRHGETTTILKCYTDRFGLRSYVVRTGRKGTRMALLLPLNRLEMVVTEDAVRDLNNVREMRVQKPFMHVHRDPVRTAVALFVQEVLYKVLRVDSSDERLFAFLLHALDVLDEQDDLRHFPLLFLLHLSDHLGFLPSAPIAGEDRFDLLEGHFTMGDAPHGHTMGPPLSGALAALLSHGTLGPLQVPLPLQQRRSLLDHLLLYFRMHVEGLGELRSPAVLHQVLS